LGRIVGSEGGATRRQRIIKGIVLALRSVGSSTPSVDESRDVLAFLALCLDQLKESVVATAGAWERREYWVKADRFRADWAWVSRMEGALEPALKARDWERALACGTELARILAERSVRVADSRARPWRGAWDAWLEKH
jgi:hypothetical protein